MVSTLILWTHALAALLFGALTLWALRRGDMHAPRTALVAALATTAVWALAVAGVGAADMVTRLAESIRNLAWLSFMILLHRRDEARPPFVLGTVYGVVALVVLVAVMLQLIAGATVDAQLRGDIINAALLLRMLVAVAGLVLVQSLYSGVGRSGGSGLRAIILAIAAIWLIDLNLFSVAYLSARWPLELIALRGLAMTVLAGGIGIAMQRRNDWSVQVSRTVAYQSLSLVAIGLYFALLALATSGLAAVGGDKARLLQTAFVFGSTTAILTLVSSPWLRAWAKVKLAKHFFRHRYDYRAEWTRFTETLGQPEGAAPLDERIVKAVADLTDSPGGLLLVRDGEELGLGATWHWERDTLPATSSGEALARHLLSNRILELDTIRAGRGSAEDEAAVPQWMIDLPEAWIVVPLPHLGRVAGAILLARPPVQRPLDWEDFDLLKVAGRQVASYLAEARAQEALADAQRFDEFNRRFAFIIHDIKNLVSQLTLVARNAERHADNPEFRADMIATLKDSAGRMNDLLARLSQHHAARSDSLGAVEVVPLVERVAAQRRGQHPVLVTGARDAIAHADPARLEQLLGHLLQNAIEASKTSDPVTLAVGGTAGRVTVDVIDNGCGMTPAFVRDKLFKPFVSSKPGGFGIGAFEALQLANAMEARLEVFSQEGRGTRFLLSLRAAGALPVERAA